MAASEDTGLTARPADHLDSTYTCLNNPENHQRISRTESPEPSADERPTEEGRKGGEAVRAPRTGGRELGRRGGSPAKQSPSLAGKSGGAGRTVFRQQARLSVWEVIS